MQASVVAREFTFNGVKIPDPDKSLSPEEVRSVLATLYPDIATASITSSGITSFAPSAPRGDFP
jgi:PRTRC genetic system protein C